MRIGEAKQIYYSNRKQLTEQMRDISRRREEAEKNYALTNDESFSEEAASLELSYDSVNKIFEENQKVLDSLMDQWSAALNAESSKQAGEAAEEEAINLGKIMMVFRRLSHGDIVPVSDERKLMEYDNKMYSVAKNMQALAQQLEKEIKKHKSLWEDEEKAENPDPMEVADNTEFAGDLPDIEIPETE